MQHHPAIWKGLLGPFNVIFLSMWSRNGISAQGVFTQGVLLSVAKMDINYSSPFIRATWQGDFAAPFVKKVGLFTHPLLWACPMVWFDQHQGAEVLMCPTLVKAPRDGAHFHSLWKACLSQVSKPRPAGRWDVTWRKGMVPWSTINWTLADLTADSRHSKAQAKLLTTEPNKSLMF